MAAASPSDETLAGWGKALGHPARLAILRTLGQRAECTCGEVVEVVGLAQSTVSQHLKVLREAGLVAGRTDGPRSCYCLSPGALAAVSGTFSTFLDDLDACACSDDCTCC